MSNPLRKLVLAASLGAGIASFASVASALPVLDALAIKNAAPPTLVEEVQWRGRWGWGWGWGAPVAAGVVAGALCRWGCSLRPTTATARIIQDLIIRARRLRITAILRRYPTLGIRRRHLAMPRLAVLRRHPVVPRLAILRRRRIMPRLAILRRRRAMPSRPALPLETQWHTARSGTGLITRKPEPISGPTANVITAPERSLREGEALFLLRRVTASRGGSSAIRRECAALT